MIITIDGPTASGKSSIAQLLAHTMHMYYLNTGMFYRALAYVLVHAQHIDVEQLPTVTQPLLDEVTHQHPFAYTYDLVTGKVCILYHHNDITSLLKTKEIDYAASLIALNQGVRTYVLELQRAYAADKDIVIEGRDCGSVGFPQARIKFFLTATLEVRAHRWHRSQSKYDNDISLQKAIAYVQDRDIRDMHREIAPLVIPEHAICIDNSHMDQQQTVERMIDHIQKQS